MRQHNFAKQKLNRKKIATKRLTPKQTTKQKTIKKEKKIINIPRELLVCACVCVSFEVVDTETLMMKTSTWRCTHED